MAADILVYHATHVPVGEDQKQHLELTRDIAAKFNHDFGVDFFPLTTPVIEGPAMRIMNLRDGTKKMSKSDKSDATRINLDDDADSHNEGVVMVAAEHVEARHVKDTHAERRGLVRSQRACEDQGGREARVGLL